MSQEFKTLSFDGGMTDNERHLPKNKCSYMENFDLGNYPFKLQPQFIFTENYGSFDKTWKVQRLLLGSNGYLYGEGLDGSDFPKIYYNNNPFTVSSAWAAAANGTASSGTITATKRLFAEYKDYIYIYHGTNLVSRYGPLSSSPTFTTNWKTTTNNYTITTNGIIGKDDNLYFCGAITGGKVSLVRIDGTNLTDEVLLLPSDFNPVQLVKYGNYLAVVGYRSSGAVEQVNSQSVIYLYDYVSSDITEVINLGVGFAQGAELLNGSIITFVRSTDSKRVRIISYSGGTPVTLATIKAPTSTKSPSTTFINLTSDAVAYNDQLYIGCSYTPSTSARNNEGGIIRFGRLDANYPYSYSFAQKFVMTDTPAGSSDGIKSFVFNTNIGGSGLVAAINGSAANRVYFEQINNTYTAQASTYISDILTMDDISTDKALIAFSTYCVALTSGQSIDVYYRIDGETSFTKMYTHNTVGEVGHDCISIESTGANLPPSWGEIQFKIVCNAGASLTGYKFKVNMLNDIYGN